VERTDSNSRKRPFSILFNMRELKDEVLFKMRRRQKEETSKRRRRCWSWCLQPEPVDEERLAFLDGGGVWRLPIPVLSWC